ITAAGTAVNPAGVVSATTPRSTAHSRTMSPGAVVAPVHDGFAIVYVIRAVGSPEQLARQLVRRDAGQPRGGGDGGAHLDALRVVGDHSGGGLRDGLRAHRLRGDDPVPRRRPAGHRGKEPATADDLAVGASVSGHRGNEALVLQL